MGKFRGFFALGPLCPLPPFSVSFDLRRANKVIVRRECLDAATSRYSAKEHAMTITHRERPLRPTPQRAPFTPPADRGFAQREDSCRDDDADEIASDEIESNEDMSSERPASHVPGSRLPPRRDAAGVAHTGIGRSPFHRPVAAGVQASELPASPASAVPATPVAPTAPVAPKIDAVPLAPLTPAPPPTAGLVAGLGLLSSQEVAAIMRVSLQRLESWRRKGIGPAFIKINARTIHYRAADIDAFLAARLRPGVSA